MYISSFQIIIGALVQEPLTGITELLLRGLHNTNSTLLVHYEPDVLTLGAV